MIEIPFDRITVELLDGGTVVSFVEEGLPIKRVAIPTRLGVGDSLNLMVSGTMVVETTNENAPKA